MTTVTREAVADFFDRYRRAFDSLDGDAVANLWHVPSGIADSHEARGRITWWPDEAAMRRNMQALCDVYRHAGYHRARFDIGIVTPMGACHVHVDVGWTLHRVDGSVLQAFRTGYHLIRMTDGLRVLLATAYEEDLGAMRGRSAP